MMISMYIHFLLIFKKKIQSTTPTYIFIFGGYAYATEATKSQAFTTYYFLKWKEEKNDDWCNGIN